MQWFVIFRFFFVFVFFPNMLTSTFQSIHPNSNRNWFINWFQLELVIWNFQHRKLFYKCLDKYPKLQTDVSNT